MTIREIIAYAVALIPVALTAYGIGREMRRRRERPQVRVVERRVIVRPCVTVEWREVDGVKPSWN